MSDQFSNVQVDPPLLQQEYQQGFIDFTQIPTGVTASVVTGIGGGSGGTATGPTITITSTWAGVNFEATGNTITLKITNQAAARGALGAAAAGVNGDISKFTGLAGNTGWAVWTGGSDKTSHATYSGVASAVYTQAEVQGLMDKLKEVTEALKALQDTLIASGVLEP